MVLFLTDPPRMGEDREEIAERILNLTLEILYLLSGEDYTIVKKASGVSGGWSRSRGPIKEPPIHFMTCDKNCEKKILELTNKMIELLTGEGEEVMSVKIESVSGEETYVTDDQLCKEEEELPVELRPDGPGDSSSPERWPLYPQECSGEDGGVSPDHEDEELIAIKVEPSASEDETSVTDDQLCKAEDISDEFPQDLKRHLVLFPNYAFEGNIGRENSGNSPVNPNISVVHQSREPSSAHRNLKEPYFDQRGKIFPCSECGKLFKHNSSLSIHKRTHSDERPYSCSQCGKRFTQKSVLVEHERIHTGEKPFACSECGRCFAQKSALVKHERTHTGEKPYPCLESGKCFTQKSSLVKHQRSHGGHKPEGGKCFTHKSDIMRHERTHAGEKPYSCTQCGKYFSRKFVFGHHQRIHTGGKPLSCSEGGKCLTLK